MDYKEVVGALKNIFERLSNFFNVFDLSFFVSGSACFGALALWGYVFNEKLYNLLTSGVLSYIITSYVLGLICFSLGRRLRELVNTQHYFNQWYKKSKLACNEEYNSVLGKENFYGGLYAYLWAKLRDSERGKETYDLLNRYWVMTAVYEGLAVAVLFWGMVLWSVKDAIVLNDTVYYLEKHIIYIFAVIIFFDAWKCYKVLVSESEIIETAATYFRGVLYFAVDVLILYQSIECFGEDKLCLFTFVFIWCSWRVAESLLVEADKYYLSQAKELMVAIMYLDEEKCKKKQMKNNFEGWLL